VEVVEQEAEEAEEADFPGEEVDKDTE